MLSMGKRYKVLEVRGIPLYIGSSWIVIAALYVYGMYLQLESFTPASEAITLSLVSAFLFFGGVLLHEVAHAMVARGFDVPVTGITLVFWGGATEARANAKGPMVELLIAAAGPASTLALSVIFELVGDAMNPGAARQVVHYLAALNLLFAIFNALPGFPLDGGRVVLAATWAVTKQRRVALLAAGWSGVIVGAGMLAYAVFQLANGADGVWAVWLGFIGFTLISTGRTMPRRVALRDALEGATVADAMRPPPESIPATTTLRDAYQRVIAPEPQRTFPVTDAGIVVGTIGAESARRGATRADRPVRDAMRPPAASVIVAPTDGLDDGLEWLAGREALVVRADGVPVGSIAPPDVERWYRLRTEPASVVRPGMTAPGVVPPRPDL
jgi:Zn-dependent protease